MTQHTTISDVIDFFDRTAQGENPEIDQSINDAKDAADLGTRLAELSGEAEYVGGEE